MNTIDKPEIQKFIETILKRKTPLIVAKAITKYNRDKLNSKIVNEYRDEFNFNDYLHRHHFNKNMLVNKCNCVFCSKSKEYTNLKLQRHRVKRMLYNDFILVDTEEIFRRMDNLDGIISAIRREKNDLKRKLEIQVD